MPQAVVRSEQRWHHNSVVVTTSNKLCGKAKINTKCTTRCHKLWSHFLTGCARRAAPSNTRCSNMLQDVTTPDDTRRQDVTRCDKMCAFLHCSQVDTSGDKLRPGSGGRTTSVSSEKRQRTRSGRGPHDDTERNGRGPDAGVAVSPKQGTGNREQGTGNREQRCPRPVHVHFPPFHCAVRVGPASGGTVRSPKGMATESL
eukprot:gene13339-biopygen3502